MDRTPTPRTAAGGADPTGRAPSDAPPPGAAVHALQRLPVELAPDPNLLRYYLLTALLFGPGFLIAIFPYYFRFRTLRYEVDEEGITMRWGILFRREVSLTYARIQDIQLSSNVVERWLGLAKIQLQTASGSASAEMTIEGLRDVEPMRDFLYARMRGARDQREHATRPGAAAAAPRGRDAVALDPGALGALTATLNEVASEIRALRHDLGARDAGARRGA